MRTDKIAHHRDAFGVIEDDDAGSALLEQILRALEVAILSDDHAGDTEQQCRPGAHDAGAKRADQSQLCPISSAACIPKANGFGMGSGISVLNPQVMPTRHDLPSPVSQDGADR